MISNQILRRRRHTFDKPVGIAGHLENLGVLFLSLARNKVLILILDAILRLVYKLMRSRVKIKTTLARGAYT